MSVILFLKSRIKGYYKKDGTFIPEHSNKVIAAPKSAPTKAKTAQWPGWNTKKPLDLFPGEKVPPAALAAPAAPAKKWTNSLHSGATSKGGAPKHKQPGLWGSGAGWSKPSYPNAVDHPQRGEDGKPFQINEPSQASGEETWTDPKAIAQFTPGSAAPAELNGIALAPWTDHPKTLAGWEFVPGQMPDLEEPEMDTKGKDPAAGVIIEEPDGRVWIVKPTNGFAGYRATFPKGHADDGLSLQQTAIKEAFEESGIQVEITGFVGDIERSQTMTRYYRAKRVGGSPVSMGWESQAVALVPKSELHATLNRDVDRNVATAAGIEAPKGLIESADDWEKVGKQAGSNPGGVFTDPAGQAWYLKLPKTSNIAKNEVLAAKLYEAAGVAVPELKHVTVGGKLGIASKIVENIHSDPAALEAGIVPGVKDGFAVDAWLANWDAVGLVYDNLMIDSEGKALRVDVGGSLVFRAQGEPKGSAFGNTVGELETLINGKNPQATAVFGDVTPQEIAEGAAKVALIPDKKIRELCAQYGPGDSMQRKDLATKLIARKADLLARTKKMLHGDKKD